MSSRSHRLAEAVKERRRLLNLTHDDVTRAGGPSDTTLSKIENAAVDSIARKTFDRLDVALRWTPGTARALWEGSGTAPAVAPSGLADYSSDDLLDELRRRLNVEAGGSGVRDAAPITQAGSRPAIEQDQDETHRRIAGMKISQKEKDALHRLRDEFGADARDVEEPPADEVGS